MRKNYKERKNDKDRERTIKRETEGEGPPLERAEEEDSSLIGRDLACARHDGILRGRQLCQAAHRILQTLEAGTQVGGGSPLTLGGTPLGRLQQRSTKFLEP